MLSRMNDDAPGTVLVADDEDILLRLVVRVLERAGYEVRTARDVDETRRSLAGAAFDAVVLDATLAPGGAEELLDEIGRAPGPPGVVLTSGAAPSEEARRALEALGGRFLAKPFAPAVLLEALQAVRAGRGA